MVCGVFDRVFGMLGMEGVFVKIFSNSNSVHIPRWRGPLISDVLQEFDSRWMVTPAQAVEVWGFHPRRVQIPYTMKTIQWCAAQNRLAIEPQEWRLFYLFDFSLREMYELLNSGSSQMRFDPDLKWLARERRQRTWADESIEARCYLTNLSGNHENMSWFDQEHELRAHARPRIVRAPSAVITQAVFDFNFLHDKRLLIDWSHWGPEESSEGHRVCVGPFGEQGLAISTAVLSSKDPRRALCYMMPPEF